MASIGRCSAGLERACNDQMNVHSGATPRGLPLSDAAKAIAADSKHNNAATPFIFDVCAI